MKKALLAALVSALILFTALALKKQTGSGDAAALAEGSSIEGLKIVNREKGRPLWSFTATKAALSENGRTARLDKVRVKFAERNIEVEAGGGLYGMEDKDLSLGGGITAKTENYTITTDSVRLLKGGELVTDDRVVMEGKGVRVEGQGFRAKDSAWVLKNVTALLD